ncbi:MAG: PEP-CTERM sorting domain-containing protein [Armatimonadota bacterium]
MKKLICVLAVLFLMGAAANAAVLFSEDFSNDEYSVDPDWTTANGWIYNATNWQTTVNPNNYESAYNALDANGNTGKRAGTFENHVSVQDLVVEADIYDLASENSIMFRSVEAFPGGWNTIGFYVTEFAADGKGGGEFYWFDSLYGTPDRDTTDAWVSKGFQNWTPQPFVHGINKIHVKVTAIGQTFRGQAWAYDANGVLACTVDTTTTFNNALVLRSGAVGLGTFSSSSSFDNIVISDVPEPGSMMAIMTGLGFAGAAFRKRRA